MTLRKESRDAGMGIEKARVSGLDWWPGRNGLALGLYIGTVNGAWIWAKRRFPDLLCPKICDINTRCGDERSKMGIAHAASRSGLTGET